MLGRPDAREDDLAHRQAGRQLAGAVTTERGARENLAEELEAVLEALEVRLDRVVAVVDARRLERVGAAGEHGALGLLTVEADDDRGGTVDLVERYRECLPLRLSAHADRTAAVRQEEPADALGEGRRVEAERAVRVVEEVPAHRQVVDGLDARGAQVRDRPDAGALQDRRRRVDAGGEDDEVGGNVDRTPVGIDVADPGRSQARRAARDRRGSPPAARSPDGAAQPART